MNSVPFTIEEIFWGFGIVHGIAHDTGDSIRLEYQLMDNLFKSFKGDVRSVNIPIDDLQSVEYESSWCKSRIVLQAKKMDLLADVPGMSQGRVALKIAKKDRGVAAKFVNDLHEFEEEPARA